MQKLLPNIYNPKDLRNLELEQLPKVAKELREFIIDAVAAKEGHLGSSLGVVELTIALHYVFDTPNDLLIWDVGHQAYGHKILTERREKFDTNRQLGGISGFPKIKESKYDAFGTGHSSTSISAALGMAIASQIKGDFTKQHIAVIGDASIASGMAFEGLNHAGVTDANLLIVLNDNAMGIDPSVGALKNYFTNVKAGKSVRKNNIIEALNFNYSGPIDGHNLVALVQELERLKNVKGPKFLHIITTKGKGLKKAEQDQVKYHAPGKFNKVTGELYPSEKLVQPPKYQDVFGETIVELARKNKKIIGITPAMPTGSSLKLMIDEVPNRAFDVGIAEQHAVTLAAGMATQGLIPFCTIYSTFLQRAYDQIIHDVALQNLPVVFCIDRAGLVGEDGATHHGVFDIAYLRCIPNMVIFDPLNEVELRNILYTAQLGINFPLAIRYPRGRGVLIDWKQPFEKIKIGKAETLMEGDELAVLSVGSIGNTISEVLNEISDSNIGHYNMRFIKPLDEEILHKIFKTYKIIVTVENGTIIGGFGTSILEFSANNNYKNRTIKQLGLQDKFIEHGKVTELFEKQNLSKNAIKTYLLSLLC
ncbi:1-deoxy-D-xylulose-5-phosphate synthase [Lutibacter sp. TH_r2]|uniref:1-deoxy-D-xylulose-5-phosphate synthase n=1 Tax=Lutibacter sp. TH_r2 TaxID=3082083 RepID=UPI002954D566|nr:1-deoxy-D-xylulose-5-phosphate synthase [Lutibacter sp. TH_r2]MDV7186642.1 1-deoxy-D-xylulose-5-phosphate synthase [Lutibacter sp. TH_r2]